MITPPSMHPWLHHRTGQKVPADPLASLTAAPGDPAFFETDAAAVAGWVTSADG